MNEQNLVKKAVTSLKGHFGPCLSLYPPISPDDFHQLEEVVGGLPSDFTAFLNACNGLRVGVSGREDAHIWGTPEVLASAVDPSTSIVPRCFLPFRGDPTGERDWIVTGFKPAFGAVVRWDPWTPTIHLMASSFGHYLNAWVDYMKACYGSDGRALSSRPQGPFGSQWIKDPYLAILSSQSVVTEWLGRIAEAASCNRVLCQAEMRMQYASCGPAPGKQTASSIPAPKQNSLPTRQ